MRRYRFSVETPSVDGQDFDVLGQVEFTEAELRKWLSTQPFNFGKKSDDYRYALALGQERFGHLRHRKVDSRGFETISALLVVNLE